MLSSMATTKTFRLDSGQLAWLADAARLSGLSENRVIGVLIDQARAAGTRVGAGVVHPGGGWISGAMRPPEDVPQGVRLDENLPQALRQP